ncbi:carboxypeptidase-like regulatory domain-containing protein [Ekhidna sp.]|uniref:carboxypeptidase-like regulatory domain-containing protein n=1 Tax=Ekhidna sp. TaxID=2608089 RepID=UPI00329A7AE1
MRVSYLIFFLIFSGQYLQAQIIRGNVSDRDTKEPIPFANVFFSGTLIGTTTDLEGNFSFTIAAEGKYELIVSYIGYHEYSRQILSTDELPFFQIVLNPEVIELKDIQVNADTAGWKNNYPVFRQLFLGETQNAAKVEIGNPRDIFLFFDKIENGLYAHARKEILIENYALGYRLGYVMQEFRMEYRSRRFYSFGVPRFMEMMPKRKGQMLRWEKARAKSYRGSFSHFLRSFKENTFVEEGFIVQELYRVPNRKRPPESLIKEKISAYDVSANKSTQVIISGSSDSDSLRYWMSMRRLPTVVDSLGKVLEDNGLIKGESMTYEGYLKIIYTKEPEEPGYSRYRRGGGSDNKQTSIVYFTDFLRIYENGYYDVEKVFFEGYMGWSSKIAEMLPLEYIPKTD